MTTGPQTEANAAPSPDSASNAPGASTATGKVEDGLKPHHWLSAGGTIAAGVAGAVVAGLIAIAASRFGWSTPPEESSLQPPATVAADEQKTLAPQAGPAVGLSPAAVVVDVPPVVAPGPVAGPSASTISKPDVKPPARVQAQAPDPAPATPATAPAAVLPAPPPAAVATPPAADLRNPTFSASDATIWRKSTRSDGYALLMMSVTLNVKNEASVPIKVVVMHASFKDINFTANGILFEGIDVKPSKCTYSDSAGCRRTAYSRYIDIGPGDSTDIKLGLRSFVPPGSLGEPEAYASGHLMLPLSVIFNEGKDRMVSASVRGVEVPSVKLH